MPHAITASLQASMLGVSYNQDFGTESDMAIPANPSVAPGAAGSLTTRTDADTGSVTADDAGHGVTTGDIVDVYWDDPADGTKKSRRTMTVGTVAGTSIPIDGGSGDDLPVADTSVVVSVQHYENAQVAGDDVVGILFNSGSYKSTFILRDSLGAELLAIVLDPNSSYVWTSELGLTNPIAGDTVDSISFSHESSTDTVPMQGAIGYN